MLFLKAGFEQQQRLCASIQADTRRGSPAHAAALWFGFGHHQMSWLCMQPAAAAHQLPNAARGGCQQRQQLSPPRATHYRVSGGPIMVTAHSKMFESSTRPAEKPSTGFLVKSAGQQLDEVWRWPQTMQGVVAAGWPWACVITSQLLLEQACGIVCHPAAGWPLLLQLPCWPCPHHPARCTQPCWGSLYTAGRDAG